MFNRLPTSPRLSRDAEGLNATSTIPTPKVPLKAVASGPQSSAAPNQVALPFPINLASSQNTIYDLSPDDGLGRAMTARSLNAQGLVTRRWLLRT